MDTLSFLTLLLLTVVTGAVQLPSAGRPKLAAGVSQLLRASSKPGVFKGLQAENRAGAAYSRKLLQASSAEEKLMDFIRAEDVLAVKMLLVEGADPNYQNEDLDTPLLWAIVVDNRAIIIALIEYGADVDNVAGGYGGLDSAAFFGAVDAITILLADGAPINKLNQDGFSALHQSASRNFAVSSELPESKVDSWLLLFVRGKEAYLNATKLLLDEGAAVDIRAKEGGLTPLHVAATTKSNAEIIELLSSRGADVNSRSNNGRTPLFGAVGSNSVETILALISAGAIVNARDEKSNTPVLEASYFGYPDSLRVLVANGADVTNAGYGASAQEQLCGCTNYFSSDAGYGEYCNVDVCKSPQDLAKMKKLLD